ncbi:Hpt domain-containing protein [Polluticoccus soli]|uniref:Hpt domain-containing protein n=1 Tax=Polluticoccus soli TaxID=3034150 RepID=UPI0023E1137B|nr:Hpt domain-containing protein [Flavipsychrobacter sp. JY13-12]
MQEPLIDFDFLREISGNDPEYMFEVIQIFLDSTPAGIRKLDEMIRDPKNWDDISKQAHSLKSSVSVIKIRGVFEQLAEIEGLTRQKQDLAETEKERVRELMRAIATTFGEAEPVLADEMNKYKPVGE